MTATNATHAPDTPAPVLAGVYETAAADPAVRVQDDLFRHVNGGWLRDAEIPADRAATGVFTVLRDEAEAACREVIEEAAQDLTAAVVAAVRAGGEEPVAGTVREKIGSLYASFMDEEDIEVLGAAPLEADLVPVMSATSKEELAAVLGWGPAGFMGAVDAEVSNDLNDPDHYTTWMGQSGIGLPDESYYREEDQADVRAAYVTHVSRMLDLVGLATHAAGGG